MATEQIRAAIERNVKAVTLRPTIAQNTAVTRIRLRNGLACDIEEGPWRLVAGMAEKFGGTSEGPTPGVFGRAALGSCLAVGYAMWAARLGIQLDGLDIEIHADYDARGELGLSDDIRPGYSQIRYVVHVSSPASEAEITRWLDTADRYSSWRDNIANAVPIVREVRLSAAAT
jgi:uncharacterized OsmC-like protein